MYCFGGSHWVTVDTVSVALYWTVPGNRNIYCSGDSHWVTEWKLCDSVLESTVATAISIALISQDGDCLCDSVLVKVPRNRDI